MANDTLSGNSANYGGGGIVNADTATLTITRSTLSGNSADYNGGGIYDGYGTVYIGHTILDAGSSGANICKLGQAGAVISLGYNLSSDNAAGYLTATGDQINTAPRLGPLQDNGGPPSPPLAAPDSRDIHATDPNRGQGLLGPRLFAVPE